MYVKAGLEKDKAAMLVVLAALRDGQKVILAVESGYRESTESWAALLRDLKRRGLRAPKLVVGDGHLGIWGAMTAVFPEVAEQRCWNHRLLNVLDKLPLKRQAEARSLLTKIPYAVTRDDAERQKRTFQAWCTKHGHAEVGRLLERDWERLVTFYQFPREHWKHLRTSNPIESPFAAVRLRTAAAKRFKKVENATAVIWKTLLIAEKTFRRLDAPELLADVASGVVYINGVRAVNRRDDKVLRDRRVLVSRRSTGEVSRQQAARRGMRKTARPRFGSSSRLKRTFVSRLFAHDRAECRSIPKTGGAQTRR